METNTSLTDHLARYLIENRKICATHETNDDVEIVPLCNFTAQVKEELALDDGVEVRRNFVVTGELESGIALPEIRVPATVFGSMKWVTQMWGIRAVVRAGFTSRDQLREAIQVLSPGVRQRRIYAHTGWRKIGDEWVYLTAGGDLNGEGVEVELGNDERLNRYRLPNGSELEDPQEAIRTSLRLLEVAPLEVTAPLWAAAYRAPLIEAIPIDLSLWLEGQTGTMKSTLSALFLSHFGDFRRETLPGAWKSTANQLERRAFILKDVLFVIDDYAPSDDLTPRELEAKASRVIRAQGNNQGRGRLRADLSECPEYPPRGLVLSTGEQHPTGQSVLARALLIKLQKDAVNIPLLTELQRSQGRLRHAMAGYVTWLSVQMDDLPKPLRSLFEKTRDRATGGDQHLRIPEAVAHLWLGIDYGLKYAEDLEACSQEEASQYRDRCWEALISLAREQGHLVENERPTRRFLAVLQTLLTQRRAVLLPKNSGEAKTDQHNDLLGWYDTDSLYLLPEAAYKATTKFCRDMGETFPVQQTRLWESLAEEGITVFDTDRHTTTAKVCGRTKRVLRISREVAEDRLGEAFSLADTEVTEVTGSWT